MGALLSYLLHFWGLGVALCPYRLNLSGSVKQTNPIEWKRQIRDLELGRRFGRLRIMVDHDPFEGSEAADRGIRQHCEDPFPLGSVQEESS